MASWSLIVSVAGRLLGLGFAQAGEAVGAAMVVRVACVGAGSYGSVSLADGVRERNYERRSVELPVPLYPFSIQYR